MDQHKSSAWTRNHAGSLKMLDIASAVVDMTRDELQLEERQEKLLAQTQELHELQSQKLRRDEERVEKLQQDAIAGVDQLSRHRVDSRAACAAVRARLYAYLGEEENIEIQNLRMKYQNLRTEHQSLRDQLANSTHQSAQSETYVAEKLASMIGVLKQEMEQMAKDAATVHKVLAEEREARQIEYESSHEVLAEEREARQIEYESLVAQLNEANAELAKALRKRSK